MPLDARERFLGWTRAPLVAAEKRWDRLKLDVKKRLGRLGPPMIEPFRGYGSQRELLLTGRVLERKDFGTPLTEASRWNNLRAMMRRFASDELPDVRVRARFQAIEQIATTNEEGYFRFSIPPAQPLDFRSNWQHVELDLIDEIMPGQGRVEATGRVLTPAPDCEFGIISDIDDTVLETHATQALTMIRLTLFGNARTRTPFDGVSAFYSALHGGSDGRRRNPVFYVSSSAWNLYDFLRDFLEFQEIPTGPILLRDLGLDHSKFFSSGHRHKLEKIEQILDFYPELPFILIGDSGQDDPTLYREALHRDPDRILAIYIRDVAPGNRAEVRKLIAEVRETHAEMLLVEDTAAAAAHARSRGWIPAAAEQEVVHKRDLDRVEA